MLAASAGHRTDGEEIVGRRIALLSMAVGFGLALAKLLVGFHAGSRSVISDGLEAAGDALSSAIVYAGLWLASKPPDSEHPYGHGRYETLSGLAVGAMLLIAGAAIFWQGFKAPAREGAALPPYALYPLLAAIVIKVLLGAAKFTVSRRIGSSSLEADAWHDISDLLSTVVALAAVGLTLSDPVRFATADHLGGILIGVIIIFLAIQVTRRTVNQLVDTMPDAGKMQQIRDIALQVPDALGIEKCFARRTGLRYHVDLHLEVDPSMTVLRSHDVATQVRGAIKDALPWVADVLVHVEPSPVFENLHGK